MALNIYFNISDYVFYILWVDGGASMDIAIIDDDNQVKDISDSDMVFNCELSHLFQHSLRKVALYTPEYVNKEDAKLALSKYLYE